MSAFPKTFLRIFCGLLFAGVPMLLSAQDTANNNMSPNLILALVGGVIIAGFIGDLIFKVTKIPSVVKLMGLGILIGPVLNILDAEQLDQMRKAAPLVGKIALLIILFAGGLGLNLKTVISQLGNAVLLAVIAFGITFGISFPVAMYVMGLSSIPAIILATLISGIASSIAIPVVTKLSVSDSIKTLLSIESALSNLFILVIVVIVCDLSVDGANQSIWGIGGTFLLKIFVSVASAVLAGVLWARLIGAMQEGLSYMLTLGFIFLLNFLVDEMGGSGAISILFFAIILANVQPIAASIAPQLWKNMGIRLTSTNYALNEFLKNISKELSFLVGTFFFVFLGLLVDFSYFTADMTLYLGLIMLAIVVGRFVAAFLFRAITPTKWTGGEFMINMGMMPRGLATAVMAFKPMEAIYRGGIDKAEVELFPFYAMVAILGSNLIMTVMVAVGESKLRRESNAPISVEADTDISSETSEKEIPDEPAAVIEDSFLEAPDELDNDAPSLAAINAGQDASLLDANEALQSSLREPGEDHRRFSERLIDWLRVRQINLLNLDKNAVLSLRMSDPMFWIMALATGIFASLGALMGRPEVVLAGMFFSPLTRLLHAISLAIITGDVYIFLKGNVKLALALIFILAAATFINWLTPLTGFLELSRENHAPTVLDYALSLSLGLLLPVVLLRGKRMEVMAITPLMAFMLIPPMVTVGNGIALGAFSELVLPGILAIFANGTALTVGGLITHYLLGLTRHPASEYVRTWKEKEVEEGALHKLFERFHLIRFLEYSGNFRARVAVIGILAVVSFVPLQLTITRLGREFSVNQTVAELARETFDKTDRSGIWSISSEIENDAVRTLIRIHTEQFYTLSEQEAFIQKVSKAIDKPFIMRLDQIPSSLEQGVAPSRLGGNSVIGTADGSLALRLESLGKDLYRTEGDMPGLRDIGAVVLGYGLEFSGNEEKGKVRIELLKSGELGKDTEQLLRRDFADRLGVEPAQIRLSLTNGHFESDSLQLESFHSESGNDGPLKLLNSHSQLHAQLLLPGILNADSLPVWEDRLERKYHFDQTPDRISMKLDSTVSRFVLDIN